MNANTENTIDRLLDVSRIATVAADANDFGGFDVDTLAGVLRVYAEDTDIVLVQFNRSGSLLWRVAFNGETPLPVIVAAVDAAMLATVSA